MFSSRARVTSNVDGVFQITMINVTESDITLSARKIIGLIHVMDELIARVGCSTISDNDPNVTPYGVSNAGASYQRMMDICLAGLPPDRILAYMDDIVIFTSTFDQHMKELTAVFTRLRGSNISLKASKCVLASDKVDFLGHELSSHGIQPRKRLTEAINDFPWPESKREVRQFLGLAGFYRNFIQNFADISRPLNRLTSDGVPFASDTNCQQAFELMKQRLASESIVKSTLLWTIILFWNSCVWNKI